MCVCSPSLCSQLLSTSGAAGEFDIESLDTVSFVVLVVDEVEVCAWRNMHVDDVTVLLQLLSDDIVKGSDESGNTGKRGQQGAPLPTVLGLPDVLLLSDWPRERAGALHGHAPTDTGGEPPGGRRGRHALPAGAGGGAFFHL